MTSQVSANAYDLLLSSLQDHAALGTYRIRLDNIETPPIPRNRRRNVTRLKNIFRGQRCLRRNPQNFIKAKISRDVFDRSLNTLSSDGVRELLLRTEDIVRCVHGSSRIEAAKSVLHGQDRWWPVALYSEDIDSRANINIVEEFANQQAPSDGMIYINLQQSLRDNDLARKDRWLSYMTPAKRQYYRQFSNRHGGIINAFNQLLPMEPLFFGKEAFHIGVFHKIASLHCDDEITNYINDVAEFWSRISDHGRHAVNASFIESIQGRCPQFSQRDHEHFQKLLEPDGVLGHLSRATRAHIYQETILYTRTIPSLFTFFQDWKYIQICCEVLTGLLDAPDRHDRRSLKERFVSLFQRPQHMIVQIDHDTFRTCSTQDDTQCFRLAYWHLWLCAMRLWPYLLTRRGRKHRGSVDERFVSANREAYWSLIAQSARKVGFESSHLRALAALDSPSSLPELPRYEGFTGAVGKDVWERWGIPYDDKYILDQNSLFLPNVIVDETELGGLGVGEDVTTLFVRRSLFLRIFPDCKTPSLEPNSASESAGRVSQARSQDIQMEDHSQDVQTDARPSSQFRGIRASVETLRESPTPSRSRNTDYCVDIYNGARGLQSHTSGTKQRWLQDLRGYIRHNFSLWDPDTLVSVDPEGLEVYPRRRIIAVPRNFDIQDLRRVRGMAID